MRSERSRRRDGEAARLRVTGMDYRGIADEMGYAGPSGAHAAVMRSLSESVRAPVEQQRQLACRQLDELALVLWKIVLTGHVAVSAGRVVVHEGVPVRDARPTLEAIASLIKLEARRAALLGLDAPRRTAVEVITDDAVEREIKRLEAALATRVDGEA
ncbi:hypothetical protein ACQPX6_17575 [Actinomycetospora sp. CA-101289]|uniref:hypothetical protein n=1 Tax=Actinomycetospora sp. CA-101289 TaxID=3239893 RepID=UPI003D97454F